MIRLMDLSVVEILAAEQSHAAEVSRNVEQRNLCGRRKKYLACSIIQGALHDTANNSDYWYETIGSECVQMTWYKEFHFYARRTEQTKNRQRDLSSNSKPQHQQCNSDRVQLMDKASQLRRRTCKSQKKKDGILANEPQERRRNSGDSSCEL